MDKFPGRKPDWTRGEIAHFEYRCWESVESSDADLWARSHQKVEVIGEGRWEKDWGEGKTVRERLEAGMPKMYRVHFPDGHQGAVFEDELFTSPEHWTREDPPDHLDKAKNTA